MLYVVGCIYALPSFAHVLTALAPCRVAERKATISAVAVVTIILTVLLQLVLCATRGSTAPIYRGILWVFNNTAEGSYRALAV